ncbi:MAG: hypothetical protein A3F87_03275 [Omnitrophica WOR_2 bacterium RIFCSPLOWO2_12_FULL_51_24]|nr:MAG: hypothetical protein A3F87_03275 [Omnitrophica WOR_2 bacterium RIFCSPLOWO2_12_FULL_51_24]
MKNRSSGFTLIEMIVVMTIIMILAGLITGAAMKAKQRALVTQTKAMISGLETALGMFQMDIGGYPTSAAGNNTNLVTNLTTLGGTYYIGTYGPYTVVATSGWSGPYMNFKTGDLVSGSVVDAWLRAYHYTRPGTVHAGGPDYTTYIDIYSDGPNKADNGGLLDDISNWTR